MDKFHSYVDARIEVLCNLLETSPEQEKTGAVQGSIWGLRRLKTLRDEVIKEAEWWRPKKEAGKGIRTEAGEEIAQNRFQSDEKKADLNNDGQLSAYERQRDDAIQKAVQNGDELEDKHGIYHCGISSGIMAEPISENPVPPGSGASDVRDDMKVMLSDG